MGKTLLTSKISNNDSDMKSATMKSPVGRSSTMKKMGFSKFGPSGLTNNGGNQSSSNLLNTSQNEQKLKELHKHKFPTSLKKAHTLLTENLKNKED
jgi:hypothetical protein